MSAISKEDVLNLREKTGAGLIDCKRALVESNGDLEEAVSILRKKGVATAAKKAGRDAGEGIIAQSVNSDRTKGILVEVNCETDFVAKNDDFIKFSYQVASQLLENPDVDLEEQRTEQVAKIGENIRISRSTTLCPNSTGLVESYVHTGGKVAVLLSLGTSSAEAANLENVQLLAKDYACISLQLPQFVFLEMMFPKNLLLKKKILRLLRLKENRLKQLKKLFRGNWISISLIPVFWNSLL